MPNKQENINPESLVLNLNDKVRNFDISKYQDFIIALTRDREYQASAIEKIIKFYLSGNYKNISELVRENYEKKERLKEIFPSSDDLVDDLQFKNKLSCTVDFATGTGKSYVLYGVAQILLCEGVVDKVLLLCPSLTIRKELYKKFKSLSNSDFLKESLPSDSVYKNPRIIHADKTIQKQDICIDNVHKAYDHVSSSIEYSLKKTEGDVLVMNDEAHHLLNPKEHAGTNDKRSMREWEKFLKNKEYNFKYILNSTGTPYKANNYFKDVICRYSKTEGIEDGYIKEINYLEKDESRNWSEKLEAIYKNHSKNRERYPAAKKNITLFVVDKISRTNEIAKDIKEFLMKKEGISKEEVEKKVVPVTSSGDHEKNVKKIETVDEPENPIEWIVSVSMLTEGWDVDNIFQIVPYDKRAFNSKLLISQVLGRGLRIPDEYKNNDKRPEVIIYNHESWSKKIDKLVMQVAEISKLVTSRVVEGRNEYDFSLYIMNPEKQLGKKKEKESEKEITLPKTFGFKSDSDKREQTYKKVRSTEKIIEETQVDTERVSKEKAVNDIYNSIKLPDSHNETNLAQEIDKDYIRNILEKELKEIGEETVTKENLQRAKKSFNVLFRKITGYRTIIEPAYKDPEEIYINSMNSSDISINKLKEGNSALMYSEDSVDYCTKEERQNLEEAVNEIKGKYNLKVEKEIYKTATSLTILSFKNEIEFGKRLARKEIAKEIDAWIKSRDKGFYSVPYIYRPGTHSMQKSFNPDFIIKKGSKRLIAEIKTDEDVTEKNKAKLRGAERYFKSLNSEIKDHDYYFYFLSPEDYTSFFDKVIKKDSYNFRGKLHADLFKKNKQEN